MPQRTRKQAQHTRWLLSELPGLVERGVIEPSAAMRLTQHFQRDRGTDRRSLALLIFGVLGALLVGSGLILVLAHNWEALGRPTRVGLALGALLSGQALCAFTILRRRESALWSEASAIALTLALGGATALIAQTYHIQSPLGDFVLGWLMLVVPVVYLMRSQLSAVLVLLLALLLPTARADLPDHGYSYLLALLWLSPHLLQGLYKQQDEGRSRLLHWTAVTTVPLGLWVLWLSQGEARALAVPFFAALAAGSALLGAFTGERSELVPSLAAPWSSGGLLGTVACLACATFVDAWPRPEQAPLTNTEGLLSAGLAAILTLVAAVRSRARLREGRPDEAILLVVPLLTWLAWLLDVRAFSTLLSNLALLGLGVATLARGLATGSLRRTNVGLSMVTLLFALRLVDFELSLVTRGVAMMVVGSCFVATNLWLLRKARREAP